MAAPVSYIYTSALSGFGNNTAIGKYAYLVLDEGVKAKINLKDSTLKLSSNGTTMVDATTQIGLNALHFSAPQANAGHKILPDTLSADFRNSPNISKVLTPNTLTLVPATPPSSANYTLSTYLPDITTYSYGVLADVRNGGLKKDLTAAFETAAGYQAFDSTGYKKVYDLYTDSIPVKGKTGSPSGSDKYDAANPDFNSGLRWASLYWFYNRYKAALPADPVTGTTNGTAPKGIGNPQAPQILSAQIESWQNAATGNNKVPMGVLAPTVIGFQNDITLAAAPIGSKFKLYVRYYPKLILYNPYAVSIAGPGFDVAETLHGGSTSDVWAEFKITPPTSSNATSGNYTVLLNPSKGTYVNIQINDPSFTAMKPGEIRVYGPSADVQIPTLSGNNTTSSMYKAANYTGILSSASYTADKAIYSELLYYDSASNTHKPLPADLDDGSTIDRVKRVPSNYYLTNTAVPLGNGKDASNIGNTGLTRTVLPQALCWPNPPVSTNEIDRGMLAAGAQPINSGPTLTVSSSSSMPETSLYVVRCRRKGLKPINTDTLVSPNDRDSNYSTDCWNNVSLITTSYPICHGNNPAHNTFYPSDWCGTRTLERYIDTTPGTYTPKAATVCANTDTGTRASSWGNYAAGNNSTVDPTTGKPTRIVLADVPIQPLTSLGQFMHIKPNYSSQWSQWMDEPFGDMFIGGSICSPVFSTTQTFESNTDKQTVSADDSYLTNQILFDSYFLSTVPPPNSSKGSTTWPVNWDAFNTANSGATLSNATIPFLNSRIVPNPTAGTIQLSDLRDVNKAAANLLLNGAFNINSTSVAAWKALLYSLSGNDIKMWDATGQTYTTFTGLNCPIPRIWSATSNALKNSPWCAVRDLTDPQVTDLATKIVQEVKTRGPFLSMADFLNRRLGPATSDLSRAGALQAAIDKTSPDINSAAKGVGETTSMISNSLLQPWQDGNSGRPDNLRDASSTAGAKFNTALGIPGYLMQQDLVQAFSPVMAARSDTFVIRTYGSVINPAINLTSSYAYCEAVVQRLPEFVDQKDPKIATLGNATPLSSLTANSTNSVFGRRFKIVSFRWLTANDL